ncbi:hypothetical protein SDRG_10506 [Saprolegnia diclina VS20]|uniref:Uncharacterized protein n=1 Tax=Saprolegnia diclina (strain VS20) TaxID=1156394 RepID=T0RHB8_SAPDV|nr:hypothetical protein SDRG_10506 [Saprolegnia diclina VS20]EQC31713.1 hypothetical protein SDRG_10506 [Saprolegnia diclina VS20]|eukprot:XP_008614720.1 hypothetical protein SDRG_10506 [Saprolegnia diclina VS20]
MAHYLKLFLSDVKNADRCRWDDGSKKFVIGRPPQRFNRVRIMGVVIGVAQHMVEIDDGSGTILVQSTVAMTIRLGDLIDCLGELQPLHPRLKCQYVIGNHIYPVQDRNMETLRFLEIIQLYKQCYFSDLPAPTDAMDGVTPLPAVVKATIKRKFTTEGLSDSLTAAAPPAEYFLTVREAECDRFARGLRQLELRANKPPYAIIKASDTVVLNGAFVSKVRAKRTYPSVAHALAAEDPALLLPEGVAPATAASHFRSYISEYEEKAGGVVVLEMGIVPVAELGAEEIGTLIYEQLEAAPAGLTLEELAVACPQLKIQLILDAVTNMQMDGIVYVANLRYLVL